MRPYLLYSILASVAAGLISKLEHRAPSYYVTEFRFGSNNQRIYKALLDTAFPDTMVIPREIYRKSESEILGYLSTGTIDHREYWDGQDKWLYTSKIFKNRMIVFGETNEEIKAEGLDIYGVVLAKRDPTEIQETPLLDPHKQDVEFHPTQFNVRDPQYDAILGLQHHCLGNLEPSLMKVTHSLQLFEVTFEGPGMGFKIFRNNVMPLNKYQAFDFEVLQVHVDGSGLWQFKNVYFDIGPKHRYYPAILKSAEPKLGLPEEILDPYLDGLNEYKVLPDGRILVKTSEPLPYLFVGIRDDLQSGIYYHFQNIPGRFLKLDNPKPVNQPKWSYLAVRPKFDGVVDLGEPWLRTVKTVVFDATTCPPEVGVLKPAVHQTTFDLYSALLGLRN